MKILASSYTFVAASKTVTFTDLAALEQVYLITNVTDGIIIYNFADPAKGGTRSGTTLTLDYDTTGMDNTDRLQVLYDDYASPATYAQTTTLIGHVDGIEASIGATNETAAAGDTSTSGLNGLIKRLLQRTSDVITNQSSTQNAIVDVYNAVGSTAETAAVADTSTSGINGLFKRLLQRITTLIGYIDALESQTDGIESAVDQIEGYVDGIEGSLTTLTGTVKAEDAAHVSGDVGVMALAVANEANTARAADGDYLPVAVDTEGNVRTVGNRDHDAVDAGEVVKVGGQARSTEQAAVASGDRAHFVTDLVGKQITLPYANPENFVSGAITTPMTGTTTTSLLPAPGAGLRNYITTIIVSNAHTTVGTDIVIQDGSGGTTLMTIPAAAVYGGAIIQLPVPLRQPTANTALFCANVTTGASTKVSAVGYKGA